MCRSSGRWAPPQTSAVRDTVQRRGPTLSYRSGLWVSLRQAVQVSVGKGYLWASGSLTQPLAQAPPSLPTSTGTTTPPSRFTVAAQHLQLNNRKLPRAMQEHGSLVWPAG